MHKGHAGCRTPGRRGWDKPDRGCSGCEFGCYLGRSRDVDGCDCSPGTFTHLIRSSASHRWESPLGFPCCSIVIAASGGCNYGLGVASDNQRWNLFPTVLFFAAYTAIQVSKGGV